MRLMPRHAASAGCALRRRSRDVDAGTAVEGKGPAPQRRRGFVTEVLTLLQKRNVGATKVERRLGLCASANPVKWASKIGAAKSPLADAGRHGLMNRERGGK